MCWKPFPPSVCRCRWRLSCGEESVGDTLNAVNIEALRIHTLPGSSRFDGGNIPSPRMERGNPEILGHIWILRDWGFWKRYFLSKMAIFGIYLKIQGCNQQSTWTFWCCWKMILSLLLIRFFLSAITRTVNFPAERFGVLTKFSLRNYTFGRVHPWKLTWFTC